jgi:hypothetical protein
MQYALKAATFAAAVMFGMGSASLALAGDDTNRANNGPNDDFRLYLNTPLHPSSEDPCHSGEIYQGAGNPNTTFQRKRNVDAGIEVALKAIMRQGADIPAKYVDGSGVVHIEVPSGSQLLPAPNLGRAAWNFTYSVNVGLNGSGPRLDAYAVEMWLDTDPSEKKNFLRLSMARLGPTATSSCSEPNASGFGWKLADGSVRIGDDEGTGFVTQNSQNLAFWLDKIDGDPRTSGLQPYAFTAGEFDVILIVQKAKRGNRARNKDSDTILHVVYNVVDTPTQSDAP